MKWRPVNRTKLGLLMALIAVIATPSIHLLRTDSVTLKPNGAGSLQFGFYDLKEQVKEIYDTQMTTAGNTILTNITNADDKTTVLKGKFTQTRTEGEKIFFSYSPIALSPSLQGHMLRSNIDLLTNSETWMQQTVLANTPVVRMQNGMLFVYPLQNQ